MLAAFHARRETRECKSADLHWSHLWPPCQSCSSAPLPSLRVDVAQLCVRDLKSLMRRHWRLQESSQAAFSAEQALGVSGRSRSENLAAGRPSSGLDGACLGVLDPPFGLSLGGWNACRNVTAMRCREETRRAKLQGLAAPTPALSNCRCRHSVIVNCV